MGGCGETGGTKRGSGGSGGTAFPTKFCGGGDDAGRYAADGCGDGNGGVGVARKVWPGEDAGVGATEGVGTLNAGTPGTLTQDGAGGGICPPDPPPGGCEGRGGDICLVGGVFALAGVLTTSGGKSGAGSR